MIIDYLNQLCWAVRIWSWIGIDSSPVVHFSSKTKDNALINISAEAYIGTQIHYSWDNGWNWRSESMRNPLYLRKTHFFPKRMKWFSSAHYYTRKILLHPLMQKLSCPPVCVCDCLCESLSSRHWETERQSTTDKELLPKKSEKRRD